ncbi:MAG: hypothetical protein CMJ49_08725 [Planctomycetaceae bacterium]|nr:hypothetical protein [Planctomycetaceae bacterium]
MNRREIGRERGRAAATKLSAMTRQDMDEAFASAKQLHPTLGDADLEAMVRDYDRERLACEPDYAQFPEMKGLLDEHVGEREGFAEAGVDATTTAYHFSWAWLLTRRITAHHLARYDLLPHSCTNAFVPESKEGGIVEADNRDDRAQESYREGIPKWRCDPPADATAAAKWEWRRAGVSSGVLLDDEPACCFPCNPDELMPEECLDDIHAIVDFMTRYREFWGPCNTIFVDRKLNAVAVEKSNCRVGYRWPDATGAAAVTACSYLTPEMNAFRAARFRKAMETKGETEADCPDWIGMKGSDRRHQRLIDLTNAEAARGATLWGMLNVVADTDVPFPDRICLAGQTALPEKEPMPNWTLTQHATVSSGPNRRTLYRSMERLDPPKPIVETPLKLVLGEGVKMKPEWQADVDAGRCVLDERSKG